MGRRRSRPTVLVASGEIEAVKSRGQSRAKLVVRDGVRMYAEKNVGERRGAKGEERPVHAEDVMAGARIKG